MGRSGICVLYFGSRKIVRMLIIVQNLFADDVAGCCPTADGLSRLPLFLENLENVDESGYLKIWSLGICAVVEVSCFPGNHKCVILLPPREEFAFNIAVRAMKFFFRFRKITMKSLGICPVWQSCLCPYCYLDWRS